MTHYRRRTVKRKSIKKGTFAVRTLQQLGGVRSGWAGFQQMLKARKGLVLS